MNKILLIVTCSLLFLGCKTTTRLQEAHSELLTNLSAKQYKKAEVAAEKYHQLIRGRLYSNSSAENREVIGYELGGFLHENTLYSKQVWGLVRGDLKALKVLINNGVGLLTAYDKYTQFSPRKCDRELLVFLFGNGLTVSDIKYPAKILSGCMNMAFSTGEVHSNLWINGSMKATGVSRSEAELQLREMRESIGYDLPKNYFVTFTWLLSLGLNPNGDLGSGCNFNIDEESVKNGGIFECGMQHSNGSLLHLAVEYQLIDYAEELLAQGVIIDGIDSLGETPLTKAYNTTNKNMASLLINHGADTEHVSYLGFLPHETSQRQAFIIALKTKERERRAWIKKQQQEFERREELKRERAAALAQQRKSQADKNQFNWAKALTSTIGFVAGNGLDLPTESQISILSGIAADGFSGDDSISNTMNAANQVTQNYSQNNPSDSANQSQPKGQPVNSTSPALPHYADRIRKSNLKNCAFQNVQANSFCQTANAYYDSYAKTNSEGQNASDIYAIHQRTVRTLDDFLKNHKIQGAVDISNSLESSATSGIVKPTPIPNSTLQKICSNVRLQACYKQCGPISFDNVDCRASCATQFFCN
jgi:hypothetical protein